MSREKECTLFCPKCNVDKCDVFRIPTGREGVFTHITEPADFDAKVCECGTALERR